MTLSARPAPLALTLALTLAPGLSLATPQGWSPLLEPAGLAALLAESTDEIRVIQVTGDPADGVIPDALWSPYASWRGPQENPGALRDLSDLQAVVRDLGIEAETPVVVVHAGLNPSDMGAAARVYWTLKSLGVQDLALLNGGLAGWREAGLPVSTTPGAAIPSDFVASWSEEWRVSTAEVAELVEAGSARLIDARPEGFFTGFQHSIALPGTIRGAENLTFAEFFDGNRMLNADHIRALAVEHGHVDAPLTVSFCNTGHWAALNWFALSELAEVDNTRLYAESMAEYAALGLPLDNAPGRLTYLWRQTTAWVSDLF
jgi:thiosulfate/3-mercaptopyruvate sulfurtransferase